MALNNYQIAELMASNGYLSEFSDGNEIQIDKLRLVVSWIEKHGTPPAQESKNPAEKSLGCWIGAFKSAKKGFGNYTSYYPMIMEMAKKLGHPDIFNIVTPMHRAINKCNELIKFIDMTGTYPTRHTNNRLHIWLVDMRRAKTHGRTKNRIWYPVMDRLAKKAGYPNLFNEPS